MIGYKTFSLKKKEVLSTMTWVLQKKEEILSFTQALTQKITSKNPFSPQLSTQSSPQPQLEPLPQKQNEQPIINPSKMKILEELAKRHDQILLKEQELASKETVLSAVEARLNAKLDELKTIREELTQTLTEEDEQKATRLNKLAHAYEKMLPKDAARLLQDLPMDLVLRLFEKMREQTVSAILSKMDPESARIITEKLTLQEPVSFSSSNNDELEKKE